MVFWCTYSALGDLAEGVHLGSGHADGGGRGGDGEELHCDGWFEGFGFRELVTEKVPREENEG